MGFADYFKRNKHALRHALKAANFDTLKPLLESQVIGIVFDNSALSKNGKIIAETALRILARFYPKIAFKHSDESNGVVELRRKLKNIAKEINPRIEIEDFKQMSAAFCIGQLTVPCHSVYAKAHSWNLEISTNSPTTVLKSDDFNPFSSVAAAGYGCAEIFNHVFDTYIPNLYTEEHYVLSLNNYQWEPSLPVELSEVYLEDIVFAGLGAVGNAALYTLGHMGNLLSGSVTLVDNEKLDISNIQRYITTTRASEGILKTTLGKYELDKTLVNVQKYVGVLGDFVAHHRKDSTIDLIAISVDNRNDRVYAQALLPKIIINGWTADQIGSYGEFGVSRHWFDEQQACLACIYASFGTQASQLEMISEFTGLTPPEIAQVWGQPLSEQVLISIAQKKNYPLDVIRRWIGKTIDNFYIEAGCSGVLIEYQNSTMKNEAVVPLAHQSVLSGALLAAEIVKVATGLTSPNDLASIRLNVFQVPSLNTMTKIVKTSGCICHDEDYILRYKEKYKI